MSPRLFANFVEGSTVGGDAFEGSTERFTPTHCKSKESNAEYEMK